MTAEEAALQTIAADDEASGKEEKEDAVEAEEGAAEAANPTVLWAPRHAHAAVAQWRCIADRILLKLFGSLLFDRLIEVCCVWSLGECAKNKKGNTIHPSTPLNYCRRREKGANEVKRGGRYLK